MKRLAGLSALCIVVFFGCKKQDHSTSANNKVSDSASNSFISYTIRAGQQFCDQNSYVPVDYDELRFVVKFDSSAIYKTTNSSNQYDINKLYGFSDNNAAHQQFSARFGWRWNDNALRIFAYVYNGGIRTSKELGTIQIGSENTCSIKIIGAHYTFSLNDITETMARSSNTIRATGYKLYPYFGGNEAAPHEITILIKELKTD